MFNGIHEKDLCKDGNLVKIRYFSGAKISDIREQIPTLLKRNQDVVVLHVGTNDAPKTTSNAIVDGLLTLKADIMKIQPKCKVILSTPTIRSDNGKADLTIRKTNKHLKELKIEIVDNSNITFKDLGKKGLHLSNVGKSKLCRNLINKLKEMPQ